MPNAIAAKAKCFGERATIRGTSGDDELTGTAGRDVIVAKGGNDTIDAGGGRDLICAGGGDFDVVFAGGGGDRIKGQGGFNIIFPGAGNDFVNGGPDGTIVTYEGSSQAINANLSTGIISGQGRDEVKRVLAVGGSEADDTIVGDDGFNELLGNGGNDTLSGLGDVDILHAGAGNDTIDGGDGQDILDAVVANGGPGIGDDTLATSGVQVDLAVGTATGGADVGTDTFTNIEGFGGTLGDDVINGTEEFNELFGFAGNDEINGLGGNDVIAPGTGDDTADGGEGDDALELWFSHPFEPGFDGPVNVDLGAQTVTGQGDDEIASFEGAMGTLLDDTIIGSNEANPLLLGDEGSDTISGLGGNDYLDGDIFFFGLPENLPGEDSLDGGDGEDLCLGGESNVGCESLEPPPAENARVAAQAKRTARVLSVVRQTRMRFYGMSAAFR